VFRTDTTDAVEATRSGLARAREEGLDTVIVDTAGRLQIDEELMDELARVRDEAKPTNVLLVLDAMTGQEAVNVAEAFHERIAFDGVVLSKLDGDARGGAALSVKAITGKPIKFASTGEKVDALEVFHPDRMASRILGMGDVLTLIERAEAAADAEESADFEQQLAKGQFTFDDFLKAYKMLRRMGPLQGILKMIPGMKEQIGDVEVDDSQLGRVEAIVLSMTPQERRSPIVIDGKRRLRVARGSGTTVEQVNQLLEARKQMEKMMKQMGRGKMPGLPGLPTQQAPAPSLSAGRKSGVKRKKKRAKR
jgi:signal recognition particle subunit SRP54